VNSTPYRHGRYANLCKDRTNRRQIAGKVAAARHLPGQGIRELVRPYTVWVQRTPAPQQPPGQKRRRDGVLNSSAQASQSRGNEFLHAVIVEQQAKDDE
jgi:hypothetical protein